MMSLECVLVGEQEFSRRARWTAFHVHTRSWTPPPRSGRGRWYEATLHTDRFLFLLFLILKNLPCSI